MFFKHLIPPFAKMCIFFNMRMEQLHFPLCQMLRKLILRHALEKGVFFFSNTELMFWIGFVKFKATSCLSEAYLLLFG